MIDTSLLWVLINLENEKEIVDNQVFNSHEEAHEYYLLQLNEYNSDLKAHVTTLFDYLAELQA
jgi:hypothetical protein